MKIVIDIPEKVYGLLKYFEVGLGFTDKKDDNDDVKTALMRAVINGSPLPEHHGRLIDVDALYDNAKLCHTEEDGTACVEWREINDAPTIIEADKESEE